jgi:hypothetical protein
LGAFDELEDLGCPLDLTERVGGLPEMLFIERGEHIEIDDGEGDRFAVREGPRAGWF